MSVLLETSAGNIVIDVFTESAPFPAYNFLKLCKINHYFFAPFYDIVKDKSISSGNPDFPATTGNTQISSYVDISSLNASKQRNIDKEEDKPLGLVSFICENGTKDIKSLFLISLTPLPSKEDSDLSPFGRVIEGFEVLQNINNSELEGTRLKNDIRILQTHILYDPFLDPPGLKAAIRDNTCPSKQQIESMRIAEFEDVRSNDLEESTYQALALELMGDLSHFKIKPSPKVLFLAKLNPITTSESLEIIFGRFGTIVNAHVVSDPNTNKSLCYAFIEFSEKSEAESAYHKLSKGCYIDGRDIVVDFSQSTKYLR